MNDASETNEAYSWAIDQLLSDYAIATSWAIVFNESFWLLKSSMFLVIDWVFCGLVIFFRFTSKIHIKCIDMHYPLHFLRTYCIPIHMLH